jgi:signal transduction histidine kinase
LAAPRLCGFLTAFGGLVVLIGWVSRIPLLASLGLNPDLPMSPTTAALFLIFGTMLFSRNYLSQKSRRTATIGAGLTVSAVGVFRLADLILGLQTHSDQWLLHDRLVERNLLGSIGVAPTTAAAFAALGLGAILMGSDDKNGWRVGQSILILVLLLASTVDIGHLYHALQFYQVQQFFPMAPATATIFLIAAIGAASARPEIGIMRIVTAPNLGGALARRLFPIIVVVPPLLGLLSLTLARESGLDPLGAIGALVTLTGVALAAAVLITAQQLEKTSQSLALRGLELEVAQKQAEDANRAKSEFLANMSHELRTPLNAVIGFSEIMREASFGPLAARYREYAGDINASGRHLLTVVNQILDLAKVESQQLGLDEGWYSLPEIADACLTIVQGKALKGRVTIETDLPADLPLLFADQTRLRQILLNLLSNAIKFTPAGGTVILSAQIAADHAEIRITDTGIGMNAAEIAIAFTPFRQVDSSLSRRYEGTGLGLPLAKALVEQHGGTLALESQPGLGTTAILILPADRIGDVLDRGAELAAV